MKAPDISKQLSDYGLDVSPKALALLVVALPLLVVLGKKLYPRYQAWTKKRLAQSAAATPSVEDGAKDLVRQLRRSFRGFLARLPRVYRRSILNFEHFIVLGAASSGKSRLLDTQTDWLYRTKQVAREVTLDPELPTYLASGAIISELPARYLEDSSESSRRALDRLWRPLYRHRSPTVVVAVDVGWLSESTADARRDMAQSVRMKVNQLAQLRRRPIEVRLALTHLDELPGFVDAAQFWVDERISNRVPLPVTGRSQEALEAWVQETRAQLPRALRALGSNQFHRFITFLRQLPELLPPLAQLTDVLLQVEPTSLPPVRGGVYLCSATSGAESPFSNASESGQGPNPLRQHALLAAGLAAGFLAYFAFAYQWESAKWSTAARELASYKVSRALIDEADAAGPRARARHDEARQRAEIRRFTLEQSGFVTVFPGFFARARERMRQELVTRIRDDLLIPQIKHLATVGVVAAGGTLRFRRVAYGLVVLHSYRADTLGVMASSGELERFSSMTQLPEDLIRDYLQNSTAPYDTPLHLAFTYVTDVKDTAAYWARLPSQMLHVMADNVVTPEELSEVQAVANEDQPVLSRFENDERTLYLLEHIEKAVAREDATSAELGRLKAAYGSMFEPLIAPVKANKLEAQTPEIRALIKLVAGSSSGMAVRDAELLAELADNLLTAEAAQPPAATHDPIRIKLGPQLSFDIDARRWQDLVRKGKIEAAVDRFIARTGRESIFFSAVAERELRDVEWNALATEGATFQGRGFLNGRFTRIGYERWVHRPIARLATVIARSEISEEHKTRLADFIRVQVAAYARGYKQEMVAFQSSFRLNARGIGALRVVLEEMSGPASIFDEFVAIVDANTDLTFDDEAPAEPSAGEGPAKVVSTGQASSPDKASNASSNGAFLSESLLAPLEQELREFDAWHKSVGARGNRAEMTKYKAILKQLLTDLTAISAVAAPAPAAKEPEIPTLEKDLLPAGKSALATLSSDQGSYEALARKWAADTGLTEAQRAPFLAPFDELWSLGRDDLERTIAKAWFDEMAPLVDAVAAKFPFDRSAEAGADPAEVTRLFHPVDGEFTRLVARYVAPLSDPVRGGGWKPSAAAAARVRFPPGLYTTVNAAANLAARLWDNKGNPRPLTFRVVTVPFATLAGRRLVPTAVSLKAGAATVLNVNQKPQVSTLSIDWTKDESAQISLRVGDVATQEASFPAPLVAGGPGWRFWRLLSLATQVEGRPRGGAQLYEWRLRVRDGDDEKAAVRVEVLDDPWSLFSVMRGGHPRRG
jgi:type VI secretion system protein ImpL